MSTVTTTTFYSDPTKQPAEAYNARLIAAAPDLYAACAALEHNYPDDPGISDLDDEQSVGMTLGQLRKVWSALRKARQ